MSWKVLIKLLWFLESSLSRSWSWWPILPHLIQELRWDENSLNNAINRLLCFFPLYDPYRRKNEGPLKTLVVCLSSYLMNACKPRYKTIDNYIFINKIRKLTFQRSENNASVNDNYCYNILFIKVDACNELRKSNGNYMLFNNLVRQNFHHHTSEFKIRCGTDIL